MPKSSLKIAFTAEVQKKQEHRRIVLVVGPLKPDRNTSKQCPISGHRPLCISCQNKLAVYNETLTGSVNFNIKFSPMILTSCRM